MPVEPLLGGIRTRLLSAFLLVATVPLAVLATWTLLDTNAKLERLQLSTLADQSALVAYEFEKAFIQARLDLFALSRHPALATVRTADPVERPREMTDPVVLALARCLSPGARYVGASYIDEIGVELARVERIDGGTRSLSQQELRDYSTNRYIVDSRRSLLEEGEVAVANLDLRDPARPDRGVMVRMLTRLFSRDGRGRGMLALDFDVAAMATELRAEGVTAEALVLIDGRQAFFEDSLSSTTVGVQFDLASRHPVIARLVRTGPSGAARMGDSLGATRPIEVLQGTTPWHTGAVQSLSRVRAPLARTRAVSIAVILASLLVAVALGWTIANRLSRPIRSLARGAARIGHGDFDVHFDVRTGDEIEQLGDAINRMTSELRASYENLEQRIADKTSALSAANDELKDAYEELREAHQRLKESEADLIQSEKLSSIGRLAASVAHEINNPVGIISMYAQLLQEEATDPAMRQTLSTIIDSADKASATVKGLLDFSRRAPMDPRPTELAPCVRGAAEQIAARTPGLLGELDFDHDPALVVPGDPAQLTQVFRNLLENAGHAAPGQTVVITARRLEGEVEVRVDDQGPGIPVEVLPKVFEPFFTTRAADQGTGLGLAIVYGIVRSHHGTIRAENRPGGGASFVLRLPLHQRPTLSGGK